MKKIIFFTFTFLLPEQILIKLPTRERPYRCLDQLDRYYGLLSGKHNVQFVLSIDSDDKAMNNQEVIGKLQDYPNLKVYVGERTTKVGAINRDIDKHLDFEILLLASDDMTPVAQDYDQIIVDQFKIHFPDLDGTLHFDDGHVGQSLNTFPIMGKKYYDRFGYIYHPDYQSIECDREYTIVSEIMSKSVYIDQVLFRHDHPLYGVEKDGLFKFNETPKKHREDRWVYQARRRANFYLNKQTNYINSSVDKLTFKQKLKLDVQLSILIPTLDCRQDCFSSLYNNLKKQIRDLDNQVEIVYFKDDKQLSVGYKRNKLMEKAIGKYVCFLDDDDDIHLEYVQLLLDACKEDADCVGITGIMTTKGQSPIEFEQALKNKNHSKKDGKYIWPIRHLNPIKRTIATQFKFPEKNSGEDTSWCTKLNRSGLLKSEALIKEPIYFYNYDLDKSETRS